MSPEERVYCTRCKHYEITSDGDYLLNCKFADKCYFYDTEDSVAFKLRPHYDPKED